ncbi:uncharacterized protein LOC128220280 [Mya arenaria]|uniref:uncharacterized protein LOC128220280 n=1 Tax=Mya arenaria TaxID=6604 RepID=UPI0022E79581|nr:uncharacterized protein LOC128220280 [Mya arenaria]
MKLKIKFVCFFIFVGAFLAVLYDFKLSSFRLKITWKKSSKNSTEERQRTANGVDNGFVYDNEKLFLEPAVHTDFPSADGQQPKIPHIIHQTYKDTNVPNQAEPFIRSFINHNPNWTYYFWTDDSARKLLTARYPFFLQVWDRYKHHMHRADAMRYFILHQFGGVYADLDMECLRPLDHVTRKFSCIFPPEPFPNSVFGLSWPYIINNAIILCKPGHPFLEYMMHDLGKTATRKEILAVAGPAFVTEEYGKYMKAMEKIMNHSKTLTKKLSATEPYFYQALKLPTEIDDRLVYVPNTHYFMNTFSPVHKIHEKIAACAYWDEGMNITQCQQHNSNSSTCDRWIKPPVPSKDACKTKKFIYCNKPNELQKKACHELARNDMQLKDQLRYTFTKHNYFGSYNNQKKYKETISIFDIAPHANVYTSLTTV